MSIDHTCDECSREAARCLCDTHLERIEEKAYDRGYEAGTSEEIE